MWYNGKTDNGWSDRWWMVRHMAGGQQVVRQIVSGQTDNRWSSRHSVVRINCE